VSLTNEVVNKSWQELAREAQLEREEFRCKVIEQSAEIERLRAIVRDAYPSAPESYISGSHEPRVGASRDADHCDYPDCEQHWTLVIDLALAAMKKLHESAEPDTDHPEIPAIIPAAAFRAFVDEHARLMRIRASQGASRAASSGECCDRRGHDFVRLPGGIIATCTYCGRPQPPASRTGV
jgi:hypothetical protein